VVNVTSSPADRSREIDSRHGRRFSDEAFLDTLSANDRAATTYLVKEFFCSAVDEEDEQSMQ